MQTFEANIVKLHGQQTSIDMKDETHVDSVDMEPTDPGLIVPSIKNVGEKVKQKGKKMHTCKYCGETFTKLKFRSKHEETSHVKERTQCDICLRVLSSVKCLIRHKIIVHPTKYYDCSGCDRKFTRMSQLKIHEARHSGEKPFQCEICGNSYALLTNLKSHKRKVHPVSPGRHICNICGVTLRCRNRLNRHLKTHSDEHSHHCDQCGKGFHNSYGLKVHMNVHNGGEFKRMPCSFCDEKFNSPKLRNDHIIKMHVGDEYKCDICGVNQVSSKVLESHKQNHDISINKCHECEKSFSSATALRIHIQSIHRGQRDHICDVCGRGFAAKYGLDQHKHVHIPDGQRKHKCDICNKAFFKSFNLVVHKRKHSGIKPYICEICGKGFAESGARVRHVRIHTGEKPYGCDICGKFFNQSGTVKIHKIKHHPDMLY